MPKFAGSDNSDAPKRKFEGAKEVVITSAQYYQKGTSWKDKTPIDDATADEASENHMLELKVKLANGNGSENYLTLFGNANTKFSRWGKVYKALGVKMTENVEAFLGRKCIAVFYADSKGYTSIWEQLWASNVPLLDVENAFVSAVEKSEWLRKKLSQESKYSWELPVTTDNGHDEGPNF